MRKLDFYCLLTMFLQAWEAKVMMSMPMLRLVQTADSNVPKDEADDVVRTRCASEYDQALTVLDAQEYERINGPNSYSSHVKANGRPPSPPQAKAIGLTLGKRVRADDGKLYPLKPEFSKRTDLESRRTHDEFSEKFARSARLYAAICDLAAMDLSPEEIKLFYLHERNIGTKLEPALKWLSRFASLRVSDVRTACSEDPHDCCKIDCESS